MTSHEKTKHDNALNTNLRYRPKLLPMVITGDFFHCHGSIEEPFPLQLLERYILAEIWLKEVSHVAT